MAILSQCSSIRRCRRRCARRAATSDATLPLAGIASSRVMSSRAMSSRTDEFFDCRSDRSVLSETLDVSEESVQDLAEVMMSELKAMEQRCRAAGTTGLKDKGFLVTCLIDEAPTRLWICETPASPIVTAVLVTRITGVRAADALDAITDIRRRLSWDKNYRRYELLRERSPEDPIGADVVQCVLKAPRPLTDREFLQYRWHRKLPGGGHALLFRSFEDEQVLPHRSDTVRGFTHLSGYFMRPLDGDQLEVVTVSRQEGGGSLPVWSQNWLKKLAKRIPVQWVSSWEKHCIEHGQSKYTTS